MINVCYDRRGLTFHAAQKLTFDVSQKSGKVGSMRPCRTAASLVLKVDPFRQGQP